MLSAIFSPKSALIGLRGKSVPVTPELQPQFPRNFPHLVHCNIVVSKYMLHCTTAMVNGRCQETAGSKIPLGLASYEENFMQYTPDFEIPAPVREIATKSVEQVKDAYNRYADAARQAQDMIIKSTEVFAVGAKELQEKTLAYAEANTRAGFEAASRLVKARDVKEALDIQTQFARNQMETYAQQAQELSRVLTVAAQKAQPGTQA
jgi:phasin